MLALSVGTRIRCAKSALPPVMTRCTLAPVCSFATGTSAAVHDTRALPFLAGTIAPVSIDAFYKHATDIYLTDFSDHVIRAYPVSRTWFLTCSRAGVDMYTVEIAAPCLSVGV
jgi:hypothetical protein